MDVRLTKEYVTFKYYYKNRNDTNKGITEIPCVIQLIVIVGLVIMIVPENFTYDDREDVDLKAYVESFSEDNNYLPDVGYIHNAETANAIGSALIDKLTGHSMFGGSIVTYDKEKRLWMVERGYLFSRGAFVVIEQDTGRIIIVLLYK